MKFRLLVAIVLAGTVVAALAGALNAQDIPRLPDGKPDFNGVWDHPRISDITQDVQGCGSLTPGCSAVGTGPLPYTAEGQALYDGEKVDFSARCMPWGYTRASQVNYPIEYVQTPDRFVILYESNNIFHVVPTDGREHEESYDPTWMGKSVGWYEGDTLVIDSRGFNGMPWLDNGGEHPTSDQMHLTERIRHIDADHLEYRLRIEDPYLYTEPIETTRIFSRMEPGNELLEYWCMENNKDLLEGLLLESAPTVAH